MSIANDYPHTKRMFGTLFAGTHFLALVQIKSTYAHERYRLRWYMVSENGSCVPGHIEDFGIPALDKIGSHFSKVILYTLTKGFYTVGRPSWQSVDWDFMRLCTELRMRSGDPSTYVFNVMNARCLRVWSIEHDRRNDPFRKICPSL